MSTRAGSIIGWTFAIIIALWNTFAGIMKFVPVEPGSAADLFGERIGTKGLEAELGVLELLVTLLFIIPRTSTVGFVLMVGYTGGILATNLTHGLTFMECLPIYITFVLLMIVGWFRNPELTARLRKKSYTPA